MPTRGHRVTSDTEVLGHGREQQQVSVNVARVSFGYLRDFEGMLQVFLIYVAKAGLDVAMLQK
jgi:cobalamin-dependent methionine synthase I